MTVPPKTPKGSQAGDRFIPKRSAMDGDMAHFGLCAENSDPQVRPEQALFTCTAASTLLPTLCQSSCICAKRLTSVPRADPDLGVEAHSFQGALQGDARQLDARRAVQRPSEDPDAAVGRAEAARGVPQRAARALHAEQDLGLQEQKGDDALHPAGTGEDPRRAGTHGRLLPEPPRLVEHQHPRRRARADGLSLERVDGEH